MARGRSRRVIDATPENPIEVTTESPVSQTEPIVRRTRRSETVQLTDNEMRKLAAQAMRNKLKEDYAEMFEAIPDRTKNLFKIGIASLDKLLGGGLPRGQMVHIYAPEGAGKTSLALAIAGSILRQGGSVYYYDTENTLHSKYASQLADLENQGLDYGRKSLSGERSLDMIEKGVRANVWDVVIVDTVTTLIPAAVLESSNEDKHIADQARMMSIALGKLNQAAVNSDTIIIWVNQLRANIQTFGHGKAYTTTSGKALPFYANINLYMQRVGPVELGSGENKQIIGQEVKVRIEKNKIAAPYQEAICTLIYGEGYTREWDLVNTAIKKGIITASGSWYAVNGENIAQGLPKVIEYMKANPNKLNEIEAALYGEPITPAIIGAVPVASDVAEPGVDE